MTAGVTDKLLSQREVELTNLLAHAMDEQRLDDEMVGRRVRLRDPELYAHFIRLMADEPRS